jgi:hypothetical protein
MAGKFKYANPEFLTSTIKAPELQAATAVPQVRAAPQFKYANPELLGTSLKSDARIPAMKAIETVAPSGRPGTIAPVNTIDDGLSLISQVKAFQNLLPELMKQESLYGKDPQEIMNETLNRDDRGMLSKTFDYITKPFRYETSVVTSPLVAGIEALTSDRDFMDIYSQLQRETLKGDREVSVYDALRKTGMSNWGAIPLGMGADILLSPSTYLGVGGLTKLGRLAKIATGAEKAGQTISGGSKVAEQIAKLTGEFGPEAEAMLKFAPTAAEQARSGHRALIKFMGKPIVEGAPVFEKMSALRDLTFGNPAVSKAFGTRPASMAPEAWDILKGLDRGRRGAIGISAKGTLKEVGDLAATTDLSPEELSEVFYAMAKGKAPSERVPWDKLTYKELMGPPTTLEALRAKHPGLIPQTASIPFDPELSPKSWAALEKADIRLQEGRNIFAVLPEKSKELLAKAYGVDNLTPELGEQFGKDWEKFVSGNDRLLTTPFKQWVKNFTTSEHGWKKVPGITEITLPSGDVKRIVGDLKFTNQAQESLRVFAKEKFKSLLDTEKSLGILNTSVDDYVPMIYEFSPKAFTASTFKKGSKEISTDPFFTKGRKFRDIEEAERFGMKPITDPLELIGIRQMKSGEAVAAKGMLDDATKHFGIINDGEKMSVRDWGLLGKAGVNPEKTYEVAAYLRKEGYVPVQVGKQEVFFQPEVAHFLTRLNEPFTNNETLKTLLHALDRATNVWKGWVTAANPKFHARNFVSNEFLLFLKDGIQGLNPFTHKKVRDMLMGKPGEFVTDLGQTVSYDDMFKIMEKEAMLGSGFIGSDLTSNAGRAVREAIDGKSLKEGLNPLSARNYLIETGRKFGTNVEDVAKAVGFVNEYIKTGNASESARRTFEFLYDYMDLTNFEKGVPKRLLPFYTWMSRNIPKMVSTLITEPGKIGAPMAKIPMVYEHKTKADLAERDIQYPDEIVPPFIKEQGAFPTGVDEKGRVKYYVPGLPYMDLARLSPRELASSLHPLLKMFAESAPKGGYSMFMDRPFESYKGQMVEAPLGVGALPDFLKIMLGARSEKMGTYMPGETAATLNTLLPMLRTPQKLLRALQVPSEGQYIYPSELLGQKFMPVDPATERRATLYDFLKNMEASKKVEHGIERKEGRKVVEQQGTPIPLDELLRLHALKYGPKGILSR